MQILVALCSLMLKKSIDENGLTFLYFMRLLNNTRIKISPTLFRKYCHLRSWLYNNDEIQWWNQWDIFKYYKASKWNQSPRQVEGSNSDKQERMRKVFVCPTTLTEGGHHAQRCWGLWGVWESSRRRAGQLCVWEAGRARTQAWGRGRIRLLAFVITERIPLWRL